MRRRAVADQCSPRTTRTRLRRIITSFGSVAGLLAAAACSETPIVRNGPTQRQIVSRTYARGARELRATLLEEYHKRSATLPEIFRILSISDQPPRGFSANWLVGYVDPGGYLEPYRRLAPAERANDLVLLEATGDRYWLSEYEANGRPVQFHCGLIVHFVEPTPSTTEVQVFEVVPTVWVGEHWAWGKEGFGLGRYHDIRFVEPTIRDREAVLQFIDGILK